MGLLAPVALVLALLIPAVVAMYLLKLRREERTVSSTFLWQRMVRDVEANAPMAKAAAQSAVDAAMLVLIALIAAVARPYFLTTGIAGKN
jgi:hypothetical protein